MLKLRNTLFLAALASLALGGSLLRAQPAGGDDAPEVTAPIETVSNLTPAEMQAEVGKNIKVMQETLVRVVELQQVARKQKDVIKLNCVNDKLLQVKQLLNIAEAGRTDLIESAAQGDTAAQTHHFSQITIASEKTSGLRDEAEGCIGEELVFLGPTEVTVDDPGLPDDPTGDDDFDWDDVIEPPGYASPFL
tara:strand:+ start:30464 stop:31039 length:576 start_codon:yes stop_codon:yes gene_type:complete